MVNLTINDIPLSVPEDTTIIEAAKTIGITIPNLCYLEKAHEFGACRICVVEVQGAKTLIPSCITKVSEGMVVHTNSQRVRNARKVLYELLLSDHSQDCLSCKRNQSCELQRLGKTLGVETTRFEGERSECKIDASVAITRDNSKCVLCRRCVTACNEVQGVGIINAQNRGFKTTIGPAMDLALGRGARLATPRDRDVSAHDGNGERLHQPANGPDLIDLRMIRTKHPVNALTDDDPRPRAMGPEAGEPPEDCGGGYAASGGESSVGGRCRGA